MQTAEFDYHLPVELIAQHPAPHRDESRLLILHRESGRCEHRRFSDFVDCLRGGDVLVLNDSKIIPARLRGRHLETGREFELLLLEENARNDWWAMVRPGKRARRQTRIHLLDRAGQMTDRQATVSEINADGHRRLQFENTRDIAEELDGLGDLPLPPYIKRRAGAEVEDFDRYQTIYAEQRGSVAAPTAGLHFTDDILALIRNRGIEVIRVTLHVGFGTFAPVKAVDLAEHRMHEERFTVSGESVARINRARAEGRRVVAVGSTSLRALESAASADGTLQPVQQGRTRLFIHPPHRFKVVDALLTNFHLPGSTLLMLVSAFVAPGETRGCAWIRAAYAEAIQQRYRFFSYGDAMFIV